MNERLNNTPICIEQWWSWGAVSSAFKRSHQCRRCRYASPLHCLIHSTLTPRTRWMPFSALEPVNGEITIIDSNKRLAALIFDGKFTRLVSPPISLIPSPKTFKRFPINFWATQRRNKNGTYFPPRGKLLIEHRKLCSPFVRRNRPPALSSDKSSESFRLYFYYSLTFLSINKCLRSRHFLRARRVWSPLSGSNFL